MRYEVVGARGTVTDAQAVVAKAQAWAEERHAEVMLADAKLVFGRDHLESAILHAVRARGTGTGVARDLGLETLRYLSGARQVTDAIRAAGLHGGSASAAVVVFEGSADELLTHLGWTRDDTVLGARGKSLRNLGIGASAERTVAADRAADLALERTALLDIEK